MFGKTQVQVRVIELMALLRLIRQSTAPGEPAQLAVFDGLAALQIEKVSGAVAKVVEVGLGQREHPLRGGDAPVIPAFTPANVAGHRAVDLRARRPANGLRVELPVSIAQRYRRGELRMAEAVHWHVHVCAAIGRFRKSPRVPGKR
ncbi:hypothetical protein D9M68_749540 [compost metagenome]